MGGPGGGAVVLGAGVAGLLSALVLAQGGAPVTLVERDPLPTGPSPGARHGVPQTWHPHALLERGRRVLDELLPGSSDELVAAGAVPFDTGADLAVWGEAARYLPVPGGPPMLGVSRGLLERLLRRRVLAHPGVHLVGGSVARRLVGDRAAVRGVVVSGGDVERTLRADLVVDATGRASRTPAWLAQLGLQPPERVVVDPRTAYASRLYEPPPGWTADWRALYVPPLAPTRGGSAVLVPVEGGRWCVGLGGRGAQQPPADELGFAAWAASLGVAELDRALAAATPVGEGRRSRSSANVRHRYDRLRDPVPGLVVVGDAVAAFNPVYGQGMTVAALGALALRDAVAEVGGSLGSGRLPGRAARALARVVEAPWVMATGVDARSPTTLGARQRPTDRLLTRYLDRLQAQGEHDGVVRLAQLEVFHLLAPPARLLSPGLLLRAARPLRPARTPALPD